MDSPCIIRAEQRPDAKLRLFCFPHAGAGATVFRQWSSLLPESIEVCAIQMAGRESRFCDPLQFDISSFIEELSEDLPDYLDRPYAIYGHCLGAIVGFELIRYWQEEGLQLPEHLFVSSRFAPQLIDLNTSFYQLPDDEFIQLVQQRYNALPHEILEEPEMLAVVLPILKADFTMEETYQYVPAPPLNCPITALGGAQDTIVSQTSLEAWQQQTNQAFHWQQFPGGYFYIDSQLNNVLTKIEQTLLK